MEHLETLKALVKEFAYNLHDITDSTTFEDLKMDSFAMIDFMMKIENEYHIVLDEKRFIELHSLKDVQDMIEEKH